MNAFEAMMLVALITSTISMIRLHRKHWLNILGLNKQHWLPLLLVVLFQILGLAVSGAVVLTLALQNPIQTELLSQTNAIPVPVILLFFLLLIAIQIMSLISAIPKDQMLR